MVAPNVNAPGTHVIFKIHPVLNEVESMKQGREIWDEIELCEISFSGNKQTVGGFPATDIADSVTGPGGMMMPRTYAQKYNEQYLAFKEGRAQTDGGIPLIQLNGLGEGKRRELAALHIHTVEALAAVDGNQLRMLGMGGRDLKNLAMAHMEAAAANGDTSFLRNELAKRDEKMDALMAEIASLKAANAPMDPDGDGKPGGSVKKAEAPANTDEDPKWTTFEDDDIKSWLVDAGVDVDGRWGRKRLIEEADAVLEKQGKKSAAN